MPKFSLSALRLKLFSAEYALVKTEFDEKYYLDTSPDVKLSGLDACAHFVEFGWKESRNPTRWFDCASYLAQNPDVAQARLNPFFHYLKFGRAENRAVGISPPSESVIRLHQTLPAYEELAGSWLFSLDAYAQSTGAGPFAKIHDALEHAINRGFIPLEALSGNPGSLASLFLELGDECRRRNIFDKAQSFYLLALEQEPTLFLALQHMADTFIDQRNFVLAQYFLQLALSCNDRYFWTHANLAKSLFELARYDDAIRHARIAHELEPDIVYGENLLRAICHRRGNQLVNQGFAAAQKRDFSLCRQLMNEAAVVGPARSWSQHRPPGVWEASRRLNVVILADDVLPQCVLYRVTNKVYQLELHDVSVQWFPGSRVREFEDALAFADVAIFYRLPAKPEIIDAIRYARSIGMPTYYEIDDLVFSSSHYPEPFERYANLISWEQYCGLVGGSELFRLAMRECDYGIASTLPLAEHMASEVLTGHVVVVPNSLGPSHLESMEQARRSKAARRINVFYGSGTLAHKSEFETFVSEVLVPLLIRNPHIDLTLMGKFQALRALSRFGSRVNLVQSDWNFSNYLARLRGVDINISALTPSTFNDCKSEIKWLEAAIFGIPSVLSRTKTHELTVEDGKTGFLCSSSEEWLTALERLAGDSDLRSAVGRAAREKAKAAYAPSLVGGALLEELTVRVAASRVESKPKLRVAVVNVFYPPQAIGGATRVVQENIDSLRARYNDEIDMQVFTTINDGDRPGSVRQYIHNGVRVTAVTAKMRAGMEWDPTDDDMDRIFRQYLRYCQPDIVHFHCIQRLTGSVVEAARDVGIPYCVTVHDGWWLSDHQFLVDPDGELHVGNALTIEGMKEKGALPKSVARTQYLRSLLADAQAVLAVSAPFADLYRDAGLSNVRVIENGTIAIKPSERDAIRRKVRVGFIGGLAVHKGYHLVQQVFLYSKFQNLELVLVDHAQPEMRTRSAMWNGTPVSIIGRVSQSRVAAFYATLDVLLAPSIWPESFGLVTREAAQAGLWLIASDRGAIGEVIAERRNGFRIDVSDSSELQRVLTEIDRTAEKYRRRTGHKVVLRSFDEQADELLQIYRDISATSQQKSPAVADDNGDEGQVLRPSAERQLTVGS